MKTTRAAKKPLSEMTGKQLISQAVKLWEKENIYENYIDVDTKVFDYVECEDNSDVLTFRNKHGVNVAILTVLNHYNGSNKDYEKNGLVNIILQSDEGYQWEFKVGYNPRNFCRNGVLDMNNAKDVYDTLMYIDEYLPWHIGISSVLDIQNITPKQIKDLVNGPKEKEWGWTSNKLLPTLDLFIQLGRFETHEYFQK